MGTTSLTDVKFVSSNYMHPTSKVRNYWKMDRFWVYENYWAGEKKFFKKLAPTGSDEKSLLKSLRNKFFYVEELRKELNHKKVDLQMIKRGIEMDLHFMNSQNLRKATDVISNAKMDLTDINIKLKNVQELINKEAKERFGVDFVQACVENAYEYLVDKGIENKAVLRQKIIELCWYPMTTTTEYENKVSKMSKDEFIKNLSKFIDKVDEFILK